MTKEQITDILMSQSRLSREHSEAQADATLEWVANNPGVSFRDDVVAPKIKLCEWCDGPVHRLRNMFGCAGCGAVGDFMTGIMSPTYEYFMRMEKSAEMG